MVKVRQAHPPKALLALMTALLGSRRPLASVASIVGTRSGTATKRIRAEGALGDFHYLL